MPSGSLNPEPDTARRLEIVILMSRTGGGHLATAQALEAAIRAQAPASRVRIVDLLTDHLVVPFSLLPRTYDPMVNRSPWLWKAVFRATSRPSVGAAVLGLVRVASLRRLGLPLRAEFSRTPPTRAVARASFGLDPMLPAVLVVGGGGGIGPIEETVARTATALDARVGGGSPPGQIVVATGTNRALRERLVSRTWPVPVHVLGFVDRMSDLMHACDLLVTKAGPGTIAEAGAFGLPMAIYGFIPGPEDGNTDLVVRAGAGLFEPDTARLGEAVASLVVEEPERLKAMAECARTLGNSGAAFEIVQSILADHAAGGDVRRCQPPA